MNVKILEYPQLDINITDPNFTLKKNDIMFIDINNFHKDYLVIILEIS